MLATKQSVHWGHRIQNEQGSCPDCASRVWNPVLETFCHDKWYCTGDTRHLLLLHSIIFKLGITNWHKVGIQQLANVVDESRSVTLLNNLHCPDSTSSIQGETLAPAWNSVWMDPLSNPHSTPWFEKDRENWMKKKKKNINGNTGEKKIGYCVEETVDYASWTNWNFFKITIDQLNEPRRHSDLYAGKLGHIN